MSEKRKEVKMYKSVNVNVSADKLWEIIGPGFAKAGEWSSAIDHSTSFGEGQFEGAVCDTRSCDLSAKGFTSVDERITEYDDANQTMAFDVYQGMPGFVTQMNSRHIITDEGDGKSKDEIGDLLSAMQTMVVQVSGIVTTESTVETTTSPATASESAPYFSANM